MGIQAEAEDLLRDIATTPADAGDDVQEAIDRTLGGPGPMTDDRREELVETLVANTDLSEAEARQTVDQWESQVEQTRTQLAQAADTVRQRAPEVAETVGDAFGTAALWSAFALFLGAVAASVGGLVGSPHDLPAVTRAPVEEERPAV